MDHTEHQHHQFFQNKALNELYISIFIMNLADSLISIFVPIYLYSFHYSIAQIILFFLIANIGSVVLAVPAAKIVGKVGPVMAMLISTPWLIIYYCGLQFLPQFPWLFFVLPFASSIRSLLYNFGFDLNYFRHINRKQVGSELSIMAILGIFASVLSPIAAGLIIALYSYQTLFIIGSILLIVSCVPLFFSKKIHERVTMSVADVTHIVRKPSNRGMIMSFFGYAIESSIGRIIWPVFLIIILGTTEKVGGIITFSALITVIVITLSGKVTDRYSAQRLLRFGTMLYFFGWLGSIFATTATKVFFVDSYRKVTERFILLPWSAAFYRRTAFNEAFHSSVVRDIIFNFSRVLVLPFLMALSLFSDHFFVISFVIASTCTLLYPFIVRPSST